MENIQEGARPFKNHYSQIGRIANCAEIFEKKVLKTFLEVPSNNLDQKIEGNYFFKTFQFS